jgi:hypothetical protein
MWWPSNQHVFASAGAAMRVRCPSLPEKARTTLTLGVLVVLLNVPFLFAYWQNTRLLNRRLNSIVFIEFSEENR